MTLDRRRHMVVVSRLPAPYREPLFQRISEFADVRFTSLYETLGRDGTAWRPGETGLEHKFTYTRECCLQSYRSGLSAFFDQLRVLRWCNRRLTDLAPDLVVILGYSYPAVWAAILWCWYHRINYSLRSDSNGYIEKVRGLRKSIKAFFLRRLVSGAKNILCIGTANKKYWTSYGARQDQIIDALYAVDQELFRPPVDGGQRRAAFRHRHGLTGKIVYLFVGRLIARKNLDILLRAFSILYSRRQDVVLVIAGDGPERQSIEKLKQVLGLQSQVVDLGRTEYTRLPEVYQASDVLVCPYADEPWGLTVNESMACGIPVIAATGGTCGAAVDLIREGKTGVALADIGVPQLVDAMEVFANEKLAQDWKAGCAEMMAVWHHRAAAEGFRRALT